jgi:sulfur carrier protein ThiS
MVKIKMENKVDEIKRGFESVREMLDYFNINPTTVLVRINDEIVTEDEEVKINDVVEIMRVISGG